MSSRLIDIITSSDPAVRNLSLDGFAETATLEELLRECDMLEDFRGRSESLYERVRGLLLPLRHPPVPPAREAGTSGERPSSLRRLPAAA